ncbi:hypothetical protein [Streptomyces sp. NPDC096105]|uniref:hypothetical protein n=1 Tax=Streptomyces sp. NPDC096105 TaxID=3366074 RepID=UPI00380BF048
MSERDAAFDYLAEAESTLLGFNRVDLMTDEAALLRGCLSALVSIARQMYDAKEDK